MIRILAIIPARTNSRGLPGKNTLDLLGKPTIAYTIAAARESVSIDHVAVSSDSSDIEDIAAGYGVDFIERPAELATDTARIDDVLRHSLAEMEKRYDFHVDIIVLLYANIPVRNGKNLNRAIWHLQDTGADSVQTVTPVGKFHPYWLYRLDEDRCSKYIDNTIHRRQDLEPLYYIDGAAGVLRRNCLLEAQGHPDPHYFWGEDRRVIIQDPDDTVDIDNVRDYYLAETLLRRQNHDL